MFSSSSRSASSSSSNPSTASSTSAYFSNSGAHPSTASASSAYSASASSGYPSSAYPSTASASSAYPSTSTRSTYPSTASASSAYPSTATTTTSYPHSSAASTSTSYPSSTGSYPSSTVDTFPSVVSSSATTTTLPSTTTGHLGGSTFPASTASTYQSGLASDKDRTATKTTTVNELRHPSSTTVEKEAIETQPIRQAYVEPSIVPTHPTLTPQVPEGTTILNYPGAAAAGPIVSQPQQLPVGPTSGMQQGTSHDRNIKPKSSHLPHSAQEGTVGNYLTGEHHYHHQAGGAQPVLYPIQSTTGNTPVVQQGTYPTAGTMTGTTGTGTGMADDKFRDYSLGDTAIGMYGDRPGNTGAVNNFPQNRAAFDSGNYGSAGMTKKHEVVDENGNKHAVKDGKKSEVVDEHAKKSHHKHSKDHIATTAESNLHPTSSTTTSTTTSSTSSHPSSSSEIFNKDRVEPAFEPRDSTTA